MKLMLDTNICIYLIKQHTPSVLERFISHPVGDIGISSITVAELEYGVSKSRHATKNRVALTQFLSPLEVASFDRDAAAAYGRLRATLEQKGTPIGSMDLLIAGHALSLAVRLVTNNARKLRRVPGYVLRTGSSPLHPRLFAARVSSRSNEMGAITSGECPNV